MTDSALREGLRKENMSETLREGVQILVYRMNKTLGWQKPIMPAVVAGWVNEFTALLAATPATEFCKHCGAGIGIHRREGEGTCPHCDKSIVSCEDKSKLGEKADLKPLPIVDDRPDYEWNGEFTQEAIDRGVAADKLRASQNDRVQAKPETALTAIRYRLNLGPKDEGFFQALSLWEDAWDAANRELPAPATQTEGAQATILKQIMELPVIQTYAKANISTQAAAKYGDLVDRDSVLAILRFPASPEPQREAERGVCVYCGADRSGPSAEAHSEDCPAERKEWPTCKGWWWAGKEKPKYCARPAGHGGACAIFLCQGDKEFVAALAVERATPTEKK